MNAKQKLLIEVSTVLKLELIIPYTVNFSSGRSVTAEALIKDLMHPKGTLFFTSGTSEAETVWDHRENLLAAGFGFTIYGPEEDGIHIRYDVDDFIEMFTEWGWSNPNKPKPDWMIEWDLAHGKE